MCVFCFFPFIFLEFLYLYLYILCQYRFLIVHQGCFSHGAKQTTTNFRVNVTDLWKVHCLLTLFFPAFCEGPLTRRAVTSVAVPQKKIRVMWVQVFKTRSLTRWMSATLSDQLKWNVSVQLENLQKRIYQLEEQLHSEMQLKDELEQKCRYGIILCLTFIATFQNTD